MESLSALLGNGKAAFESVLSEEEFENGWEINAVEFLRIALKSGSVWTPKDPSGFTLVIKELDTTEEGTDKQVRWAHCDVESNNLEMHIAIPDLLKLYNPPSIQFKYSGSIKYGATCRKCKRDFQYQKYAADFTCWACENGY